MKLTVYRFHGNKEAAKEHVPEALNRMFVLKHGMSLGKEKQKYSPVYELSDGSLLQVSSHPFGIDYIDIASPVVIDEKAKGKVEIKRIAIGWAGRFEVIREMSSTYIGFVGCSDRSTGEVLWRKQYDPVSSEGFECTDLTIVGNHAFYKLRKFGLTTETTIHRCNSKTGGGEKIFSLTLGETEYFGLLTDGKNLYAAVNSGDPDYLTRIEKYDKDMVLQNTIASGISANEILYACDTFYIYTVTDGGTKIKRVNISGGSSGEFEIAYSGKAYGYYNGFYVYDEATTLTIYDFGGTSIKTITIPYSDLLGSNAYDVRAVNDNRYLLCLRELKTSGGSSYISDGKMLLYNHKSELKREFNDPAPPGPKGEYPESPDFWTAEFYIKTIVGEEEEL